MPTLDLRGRLGLAGFTALSAALYATLGLQNFRHFRLGGFDLGIFAQAINGYAQFSSPVSPIKGTADEFGPDFSVLGDHFSPILAALGPIYRLWPHPQTLLLAQAVLFALSIPLVWVAMRRLLSARAAWLLTIAYATSFGLANATDWGFHETAFAVPLVALVLERLTAGRHGQAALAALPLLAVKEDMGLFLVGLGLVVAIGRRADWRRLSAWVLSTVLFLGGLAAIVLAIRVAIPAFGGRADFYWQYDALGSDAASALRHVVSNPHDALRLAVSPSVKWQLLLWLFAPLLFLPLLSRYSLLVVPFLAERLLSSMPNYWTTKFHYNAILMPILFVAAAHGLAKVRHYRSTGAAERGTNNQARFVQVCAAVVLVVCVTTAVTVFPFRTLLRSSTWSTSARDRASAAAVAHVPSGVSVEATNLLAGHLVDRTRVVLFDQTPRFADWIVIDTNAKSYPFADVEQVRARVAELPQLGYSMVFAQDGFMVWKIARAS